MRSDCSRIGSRADSGLSAMVATFAFAALLRPCARARTASDISARRSSNRDYTSHITFWVPQTMAGVPAETQGSTALKALATDKISSGILQSANLLHLLRNSSHPEVVAKLPKDLSLKIPVIKTTGGLLEQMPSVIVALDSHLDSAIRSLSMLKEVRSILVDSPHNLPTPPPTTHAHDSSTER